MLRTLLRIMFDILTDEILVLITIYNPLKNCNYTKQSRLYANFTIFHQIDWLALVFILD